MKMLLVVEIPVGDEAEAQRILDAFRDCTTRIDMEAGEDGEIDTLTLFRATYDDLVESGAPADLRDVDTMTTAFVKPWDVDTHKPSTCDNCGAVLSKCCDGIERCLECNPCPSCHDGGGPI